MQQAFSKDFEAVCGPAEQAVLPAKDMQMSGWTGLTGSGWN